MKIVALYARVSTGRQEKEETVKAQIAEIRERIKSDNNILGEDYIFVDEGWSGDILMRPNLDRLRELAGSKAFEMVYIWDRDRLSRKFVHQEIIIDDLQAKGVAVVDLHGDTPKTPGDKILYGFKGLFAEYEKERIVDRFRAGKFNKARSGYIVHGPAGYGWDYVPVTKGVEVVKIPGKWVINRTEAEIAKKIFEWVGDEGLTIRKVIKRLHEQNIRPRKSQRGVWNNSTLSRMLRSEAYIGTAYYNKSIGVEPDNPIKHEKYKKYPKSSRRRKAKAEWIPIQVPKIIETDLFERTQRQLDLNSRFAMRNKKHDYLLSGLVYCGCSTRMGCEGGTNQKFYYRCEDRLKTYPLEKRCLAGGVNCLRVDGVVWEQIACLLTDENLVREQAKRWLSGQGKTVFDVSGEVNNLKELLSKLEEEEIRRAEAYSKGVFSLEAITSVMEEHKKRKAELLSKLAKVKEKQKQVDSSPQITVGEVAYRVTEMVKTLDLNDKRTLLVKLIDGIIINQERTEVKIRGFIPLEINTNINRKVEYGSISRNSGAAECGEEYPV